MTSDVIVGHDGKPRCVWAGSGDTAFARYHDDVWGIRSYDESAMFEALTLGVFEVGLSWSIVFGKRDAFRKAFRGLRPRQGRGDDRARCRAADAGRGDHSQPGQDPGHYRQRPRDALRITKPRGAREGLQDHPHTGAAVRG